MQKTLNFLTIAKQVVSIEAKAISDLHAVLEENFTQICETILQCNGKVIVTGMGKSGHIAKKVAATMASTGTPAFFIHPAEASHGDLGMITAQDLVLIFSNSGETDELITILPSLKRSGIKIISITSNSTSKIAKYSDLHLLSQVAQEACPLNLAPTTSTTCALVLGDALAISLAYAKGFNKQDFAKYHPSGRLGKRLLLKVGDLMHTGNDIPLATLDTPLLEAILEMSKKCFGLLLIVDPTYYPKNQLIGVLSDGDLRRIIDQRSDLHTTKLTAVMNKNFKYIDPEALLITALELMEQHKIFALPVVQNGLIVGIFNMHDILQAGII